MIGMLLNVVHGEVQKSKQKHITKESNRFHNHSPLITMSACRFLSLALVLENELENGESSRRESDSSSPSFSLGLLSSFSDSSRTEQPLQRAIYNVDIRICLQFRSCVLLAKL